MLLDDTETEALKNWIIKKLEDISDADADVLAEYVLALVKTDDSNVAATKANCIENLHDFLPDNHLTFVNELFEVITAKTYDPTKPPPKAAVPRSARQTLNPDPPRVSKKRTYNDWQRDDSQTNRISVVEGGDRPMKQARRGGRGFDHRNGSQQAPDMFAQPHAPPMPPMMPPFDPNDPVAAFMAMQQAMSMLPGMPGFPPSMTGAGAAPNGFPQRCRDYDTKGFCARGASCMYDHGNDSYAIANGNDEYDPSQATLLTVQPNRTGLVNSSSRERGRGANGRGRGRGNMNGRGAGRSDASHRGPNHDRSITTIVVENIPDEKFSDSEVRAFFDQFGNIEDVSLDAPSSKRLAKVKFDSYESAKAAYDSPKVIFDNRFVKVYWFKSDSTNSQAVHASKNGRPYRAAQDNGEATPDPEEIARKQEEAQRKHEEQKRQREEAERARKELEAKLSATESARQKLAAMLAKKSGQPVPTVSQSTPTDENEQTRGLKAQLAKLEAEAKSLGIDPEAASAGHQAGFSYRGRGSFPRARGRGRGAFYASGRGRGGGAVMRLDNRPKTVQVTFTDGGSYEDHEEALRQLLLFNGASSFSDAVTLSKHNERADVALLAFPERYMGETFMASAIGPDSQLAGKTELTWFTGPSSAVATTQPISNGADFSSNAVDDASKDVEVQMQDSTGPADGGEEAAPSRENDAYDVADDYDRWG